MKKIGLIGYGELGLQIEHMLNDSGADLDFVYFDDNAVTKGIGNSHPFNSFLDSEFQSLEFLIGLGYKHLLRKKQIIDALTGNQRKLLTFIHPTSIIDPTAEIGEGSVIYPNVTIDKNVRIGKGCLLNLSVTIAHNSVLNDCCYLSPSVTLSGFVSVGSCVFIGTSACVANNLTIEDSVIVGIGSVITKSVGRDQFVIGNPQRIVNKIQIH